MSIHDILDINTLSRIDNLEIQASMLVSGFLAGIHNSPFRGSCPEFKEFRDYRIGDSIKDIDWRVSGRSDRLQVRLRDDETDMRAYVLLDVSRSMDYQGKKAVMSKWNYARCLAAALIYLLQRQGDAAGLYLLGRELEGYFPPSARRSHSNNMVAAMERNADADYCDLPGHLSHLANHIHERSMVIIISDFYFAADKLKDPFNIIHHMNCDLMLLQVLDESEINMEWKHPILLQELESRRQMQINPKYWSKDYQSAMTRHLEQLREIATGCDFQLLNTMELPIHALAGCLHARGGRRS